MTAYSSGGVYNLAYHDSETLEVDRRFVATGTNRLFLSYPMHQSYFKTI